MRHSPPPDHERVKDALHEKLKLHFRETPTGCWLWPCARLIRVGRHTYPARRVFAWIYRSLELDFELDDRQIEIRCDPLQCGRVECVNPWHSVIRRLAAVRRRPVYSVR